MNACIIVVSSQKKNTKPCLQSSQCTFNNISSTAELSPKYCSFEFEPLLGWAFIIKCGISGYDGSPNRKAGNHGIWSVVLNGVVQVGICEDSCIMHSAGPFYNDVREAEFIITTRLDVYRKPMCTFSVNKKYIFSGRATRYTVHGCTMCNVSCMFHATCRELGHFSNMQFGL